MEEEQYLKHLRLPATAKLPIIMPWRLSSKSSSSTPSTLSAKSHNSLSQGTGSTPGREKYMPTSMSLPYLIEDGVKRIQKARVGLCKPLRLKSQRDPVPETVLRGHVLAAREGHKKKHACLTMLVKVCQGDTCKGATLSSPSRRLVLYPVPLA